VFSDNKVVSLRGDDLMLYLEENNTALLTENFDIEIFEVDVGGVPSSQGINIDPDLPSDAFLRKYFLRDFERVQGGIYTPQAVNNDIVASYANYTTSSVGYYFDVVADHNIDAEIACKSAEIYNKNSYYIDLDFDCSTSTEDEMYVDIYGPVTEPEICL
jgi:hypothetical protein